MRRVMNMSCKYDIFKKTDFCRGPISDDDMKASLDRLKAAKAMGCEIKNGDRATRWIRNQAP